MNVIRVGIEQIDHLHWSEFISEVAEGHIKINENGEVSLPREDAIKYCGNKIEYTIDNTQEGVS